MCIMSKVLIDTNVLVGFVDKGIELSNRVKFNYDFRDCEL
jgi:rRNA-processing protein FCF1